MKRQNFIVVLLTCLGQVACSGVNSYHASNPPTPSASIAFVQSANASYPTGPVANPASAYPVTFGASVKTGDFIVLAFWRNYADNDPGIVSVTDSVSNSYIKAFQVDESENNSAWIYYAKNVSGGSNFTVTVTVDTNDTTSFDMAVMEYSGVIGLDATITNVSPVLAPSSLTSFNSGNATTQYADELLVGVGLVDIQKVSAGAGFTSRFTTDYFCVEDNIVTSKGTYDAPFTTDITGYPNIAQYADGAGMATFY